MGRKKRNELLRARDYDSSVGTVNYVEDGRPRIPSSISVGGNMRVTLTESVLVSNLFIMEQS